MFVGVVLGPSRPQIEPEIGVAAPASLPQNSHYLALRGSRRVRNPMSAHNSTSRTENAPLTHELWRVRKLNPRIIRVPL